MRAPRSTVEWRELVKRAPKGDLGAQDVFNAVEALRDKTDVHIQTREALIALAWLYAKAGHMTFPTPAGSPAGRVFVRADGAHQCPFSNGVVVFNPAFSNNVLVQFDEPMIDAKTNETGKKFVVKSPGGGVFLKPQIAEHIDTSATET